MAMISTRSLAATLTVTYGPRGFLQGHFIPYMVSYIIKSFALQLCIASTLFRFLRIVGEEKKVFLYGSFSFSWS